MAASCRKAAQARLWSDFFKEPSLWKDNRSIKTNPRAPDFLHKLTNEPLWLDSWRNPSWVHEKLKLQAAELQPLTRSRKKQHGDATKTGNDRLASPGQLRGDIPSTCQASMQIHIDMLHRQEPALDLQEQVHMLRIHDPEDVRVSPLPSLLDPDLLTCNLTSPTSKFPEGNSLASPLYSSKIPHQDLGDVLHHKCKEEKDLSCALWLHRSMHQCGPNVGTSLRNNSLSVLADVEKLCYARQVFDKLECQHEGSWSALITSYVKSGESQLALDSYQKMKKDTTLHPRASTFVALLKTCAVLKDLQLGERIHADLDEELLKYDVFLGSTLINMYAKCGCLAKAQDVFNKLKVQNVVSWNALIAGYVEYGLTDKAFNCYQQMHHCGTSPDAVTLVCILKACGSKEVMMKGQEVHAEILWKGFLENDPFVGSALVDMYAKCGSLAEAQEVFDKLLIQTVITWNALITGYTEHNFAEKALGCFEQMQRDAISPDAVTLICSLKACATIGAGSKAQEIHINIAKKGLLDTDIYLGSILVNVYAKLGWLVDAESVFAYFPVRDVVLWNALISGFTEHGLGEKALEWFDQMSLEGMPPNAATYICILRACSSQEASLKGRDIHIQIVRRGLQDEDAFIGSTLVYMYAKCGLFIEAQNVLERLPVTDVVSWNALICGYTESGISEKALKIFRLMQVKGILPDAVTFACSLKACSSIGKISMGHDIHTEVLKKGLIENDVGNALIDMYAKCGSLADAQNVFNQLQGQSVVGLNTILAGYIECGLEMEALKMSGQSQFHMLADALTLVCSLKACGTLKAISEGQELHDEFLCKGLEQELLVGNTLVDFYGKCGLFEEAQKTFGSLQTRDTIGWTALIMGYVEHGFGEEAFYYYKQMLDEGVGWDAITVVCILTACGNTHATKQGKALHAEATQKGLMETEPSIGGALVDMYSKFGLLSDAQKVSQNLPFCDSTSWNALLAGYVERGYGEKALALLEEMETDGMSSDASTLTCGLKACSITGAAQRGQEIHTEITQKGLDGELVMGNTLIDMYVKFGVLEAAQRAFEHLLVRDLVSWNTLIAGYGQRGQAEDVFLNFGKMREGGAIPDLVTFSSVLNACSHAGEVDMGQMYFEAMAGGEVMPASEHYTCVVDLLGRAGQVQKAMAAIEKMPMHPGIVAWHSALGACQKWGYVDVARHAFENVVGLDETDAAAYVCMCNIYANAAMNEQEM